jgi:hypothetical protein
MKTVKVIMTMVLAFAMTMTVSAQAFDKAHMKEIKKEVKKYEKEGWKVVPGSLSLRDMLIRSKKAELEEDVEGNLKWTVGVASSVGGVYDAARMQAMTLAKAELAALLSTNLTQKFEVGVNNESLPHAEAESKAKAIMAAKALSIDQKLGNPRVLFDAYRTLPNGNVEVTLRVAVAQKKMDDILGELITASNDITN